MIVFSSGHTQFENKHLVFCKMVIYVYRLYVIHDKVMLIYRENQPKTEF